MNSKINIFNSYANEYDQWFENNKFVYESELEAVKKVIPRNGIGLEIGTGTGRFSKLFSITLGIEPSKEMAKIAELRGITVHNSKAEKMPFCSNYFDFALMITTICFLDDPIAALIETKRVLKPKGNLVIGIIDKNSNLGKIYHLNKKANKFYRYANFYSVDELNILLKNSGFETEEIYQTIFHNPATMNFPDPV